MTRAARGDVLHVCRYCLKGLASLRLQFRATCEARHSSRFARSNSSRRSKPKTAAAAQAIATHGLLTRQLPPQFVHNAMGPNSHGWPRPSDAACCTSITGCRLRRHDTRTRRGEAITAVDRVGASHPRPPPEVCPTHPLPLSNVPDAKLPATL